MISAISMKYTDATPQVAGDSNEVLEKLIQEAQRLGVNVQISHSSVPQTKRSEDVWAEDCLRLASSLESDRDQMDDQQLASWFRDRVGECRDRLSKLTERERQVALLVGNGSSNKVAASILNVSEKTIEKYRSIVCRKLKAPTAAHLGMLLMSADLCVDSE